MKNTIASFLLLFFSFLSLNIMGQERIITPEMKFDRVETGDYFKNDNLEIFEGTWKWESNDSVFILVLRKEKITTGESPTISMDMVLGYYSFFNGKTLQIDAITDNSDFFIGVAMPDWPVNRIKIVVTDPLKSKTGEEFFEISMQDENIAFWEMGNRKGIRVLAEGEKFDPGFSIPTKMTLHRISE